MFFKKYSLFFFLFLFYMPAAWSMPDQAKIEAIKRLNLICPQSDSNDHPSLSIRIPVLLDKLEGKILVRNANCTENELLIYYDILRLLGEIDEPWASAILLDRATQLSQIIVSDGPNGPLYYLSVIWKSLSKKEDRFTIEKLIRDLLPPDPTQAILYIEELEDSELREHFLNPLRLQENIQETVTEKNIRDAIEKLVQFHIENLGEKGEGWSYGKAGWNSRVFSENLDAAGVAIGILALLSTISISFSEEMVQKRTEAIQKAFQSLLSHQYNLNDRRHLSWFLIYALRVATQLKKMQFPGILQDELNTFIVKLASDLLKLQFNGGWTYVDNVENAESFISADAMLSLMAVKADSDLHTIENIDFGLKTTEDFLKTKMIVNPSTVHYVDPTNVIEFINPHLNPTQRGSAGRTVITHLALFQMKKTTENENNLFEAIGSSLRYLLDLKCHSQRKGEHSESRDGIAPYYYYYNLPYLASAIAIQEEEKVKVSNRKQFLQSLFGFRNENGLWKSEGGSRDNTENRMQVYPRSMALLALSALYEGEGSSQDALVLLPFNQ